MSTVRFLYKNLWRSGSVIATSSEHPQFPAENTQDDDTSLPWRSRYGTGSGNGRFVVTTANNDIDFKEDAGDLLATITPATYTAQTLVTEIKTRMDAAGGTYTVSYSESTGKFTIARTGNFTLLWQSGANTAHTAGSLLGFIITSDDGPAETFTGDYRRIHTSECIDVDLITATAYDTVALLNHNLQSGATITFYGDDNSTFTNPVDDTLTYHGNNLFKFLMAARSERYLRIYVVDTTNPSGYIQIGTVVVGSYLQLSQYYGTTAKNQEDGSIIDQSDGGNLWAVEKTRLDVRPYNFRGLSDTDAGSIDGMIAEAGIHKAVVLCLDSTAPNTNSYWVNMTDTTGPQAEAGETIWTWDMSFREHT